MNYSKRVLELFERKKVLLSQKRELEEGLRGVKEELNEVKNEISDELSEEVNKNKRKRKKEVISDIESEEENTYQKVDKKKQKKRQKKFTEVLMNQPEMVETGKKESIEKEDQVENITIERIAEKYEWAIKKKGEAIEANKEELKAWYKYAEGFNKKVVEKQKEHPKEGEQTIRKRIYNVLAKLLPGVSREKIRKRIQNAEKVYILFKENKEEMDRVRITGMSYFTRTKMEEILKIRDNYKKHGEIII